jgi:uncharacterized membrane protein
MKQNYTAHHASMTVDAPVHQVYSLFTHFNDFPKFMSFVKEVTYYDDQTSHWVAQVAGQHEWDAVNDQCIPDRQVGWHSTKGLDNFGKVTFEPVGADRTKVDVFINYNPPAGILGDVGEKLGIGSRFEHVLQNDLNHFAHMVEEAPPGALDPTSSNYLFHSESAAAKGKTTARQDETMQHPDETVSQRSRETEPDHRDETMQQCSTEGERHRSDKTISQSSREGESEYGSEWPIQEETHRRNEPGSPTI